MLNIIYHIQEKLIINYLKFPILSLLLFNEIMFHLESEISREPFKVDTQKIQFLIFNFQY